MEQNFQTSFIPRKPIVEERVVVARSVSLFLAVSVFALFAVLIASGGLYFYRSLIVKNLAQMENDLNLAKNRFEPSRINELQILDKRLRASSAILSSHRTLTPIFEALEAVTMKTVRFTKFEYSEAEEPGARILVKMSGIAVGYRSVALQSDLFTKNKYFINPIFSNLALDNSGNVLFDLSFYVDPVFVNYKNMLLEAQSAPLSSPSAETEN